MSYGDNDGVDYVRHCLYSEKGAPLGDYEPVDGSIRMCLDEMWDMVKTENFTNPEGMIINLYIDTLVHELYHKWFCWGMDSDMTESFNEQDERAMRCCTDWTERGEKSSLTQYDWKH